MRAGDFSGTTITVKDPLTGLPFPGNVIPANRLDPRRRTSSTSSTPCRTRARSRPAWASTSSSCPETANRQRADLRIDHEATSKDSLFLRASYQRRDPSGISFEAGNGLTNLGIQDRTLDTATAVAGWTKIFSNTVVNEFRVGYNYDNSVRQSQYNVQQVNAQLGLETAPSVDASRVGYPSFSFSGGSAASRPVNITDGGFNADRTINQSSFSISDNLSWVVGSHSLRGGALWTRNSAIDGRGRGTNHRGSYRFNGARTGNALADLLLGYTRDVADRVSTRGDTDGYSNDFAVFLQDDWRVNNDLTVFLGLRYELAGAWNEKGDVLGNFVPEDGGYHVVPNAEVAALLPPGLQALGRTRLASDVGHAEHPDQFRQEQLQPARRLRLARRRQRQTVVRGGFGLFHPTVAIQGLRDLLASNMFRYGATRTAPPLAQGFSGGEPYVDPADFGNQGIDADVAEPGHLPVQPHPRARAGRRLRPARQLHRLDDAEAAGRPRLQHDAGQHDVLRPVQPRRLRAAALPPVRLLHGQRRQPGRGPAARGPGRAAAPLEGRPRAERGLHLRPLRAATPPTPATAAWAS